MKTRPISEEPLFLEYPDLEALRKAYRELPRRGCLYTSVKVTDLPSTLLALERSGFYGLRVECEDLDVIDAEVAAFKGKQGACYDTGRSVRYTGAGLAALDDDNHLIVGEMRVCEKTGSLYAGPPYTGLLDLTEADPELLENMLEDPVPFDCDTLERDTHLLNEQIGDPSPESQREALFYGGPFRALILKDGTVLRRGEMTTVPSHDVTSLLTQGAIRAEEATSAKPPVFFQNLYKEKGATALLGDFPLEEGVTVHSSTLDLTALEVIQPDLRERMCQVIDTKEPQFLITGSDPRSPFGCCPNAKVGEANRLVEAGVLSSQRVPAPPDSCPTTVYAFRGELRLSDSGQVESVIDPEFRARIRSALL